MYQRSPNRKRPRLSRDPFTIIADTAEQLPYSFETVDPFLPFHVIKKHLETGDYSVLGHETRIGLERKSKADAFRSFGTDRDRFEKEMQRFATFEFAAVIIEAEWAEIFTNPPEFSQGMNQKSIVASTIAWSQRFKIHFVTCPNRDFAEQYTFRCLERWVRDKRTLQQE